MPHLHRQSTRVASLGWFRNAFQRSLRELGFVVTAYDRMYMSISVFSVNSVKKGMIGEHEPRHMRKVQQEGGKTNLG